MARKLNFCFTKLKSPPSPDRTSPEDHNRPFPTPPRSSPFLINNSLYDLLHSSPSHGDSPSSFSAAAPENFATAVASRRFFFSSPGRSNSIIDSASASFSNRRGAATVPVSAVPTYSPDPFSDFRRSMQEMVEARGVHDVRQDWDYLHLLLTCYLALNPKSTHKFIVGAFADLVVGIVTSGRRETPISMGKRKIPRRREKAVAYGH